MGRHFSKVGATVILAPSNKKVRASGPPVPTPMVAAQTVFNVTNVVLFHAVFVCATESMFNWSQLVRFLHATLSY